MVNAAQTRLYVPNGLKGFKQELFDRIALKMGGVVRGNVKELAALPDPIVPVIGCSPELTPLIAQWRARGREFIYWDRGYARRVFATHLPRGENGGYYRWHRNAYQLRDVGNYPSDRWESLKTEVRPWAKGGRHVVIARGSATYNKFHDLKSWLDDTVYKLSLVTDRPLMVRDKESKRSLFQDLEGAHALVTHGSNTAVEAAIMGCPVFVDQCSAAVHVGKTDLGEIERPAYPDRQPWLNALAYNQWDERELTNGKLWEMLQ